MIHVKKILIILLFINLLVSAFTFTGQSNNDSLADDQLDQTQENADTVDYFYQDIVVAQSFQPELPKLTRIELYLLKYGNISSDLTLFIKDAITGGTVLTQAVVSKHEIPENESVWILFDVEDIDVEADTSYYIVLKTASGDEDRYYQWYGTNLNGYNNGLKYISNDSGVIWKQFSSADCAFRTYGSGPVLQIDYITGDSWNQIEIGIYNNGTSEAQQIKVTSSISGGFLLRNWFEYEANTSLMPGHQLRVDVYPIIGIGPATINVDVWSNNANRIKMSRDIFMFLFYIWVSPK